MGGVFFAVALALLLWTVLDRRAELADALTRLDARTVTFSLVLACAGLVAQLLSWRCLLDGTGSRVPVTAAARIYFHGQLGKYVPGSVWAVVAQAELGTAHQVSRARSAVVALGALAVLLVVGGAVAVIGLVAASPGSLSEYWWAVVIVPVVAVGLAPPVFNRVVARLLHVLRRGDHVVRIDGRAVVGSTVWALVMWVMFGLHAAVLVAALDPGSPGRAVLIGTGAFALAWVVGFLVVIAPAGAGPREAALVLALSPVMSSSDALLVALVSRMVLVLADAAAAGVATLLTRRTATPQVAGTGSA